MHNRSKHPGLTCCFCSLGTMFLGSFLICSTNHAANYDADNASALGYASGWGVSAPEWSLDGTIFTGGGLGGWSLRADQNAAVRIESVSSLGAGTSLDSNGKSFRLSGGWYQDSLGNWVGGYAHAKRYLDPSGLDVGQSFSFRMAVNYRNGNKGVGLYDATGAQIFNFNVGVDNYVVNVAATGTGSIGVDYSSDTILDFRFEQTSSSGGTWKIVRTGGVSSTTEGTYAGVVRSVEWYAGATDNNNPDALFFNNLVIGPYRTINLAVDMSVKINKGVFAPSIHGLEVKGSFNNWGPGIALTDPDGDKTYSASILYPGASGTVVDYRMRATSTGTGGLDWEDRWSVWLASGGNSGGSHNRSLTLSPDRIDQTVPTFYFGDDDGVGPVITRNGEATINLQQNASYSDAGATATDAIEGSCVVTTSISSATLSTFTQTPGTYLITYNSLDAAGNSGAPATRTVVVTAVANDGYDAFIVGKTTNSQTLAEYAFGAKDVGVLAPADRPQVAVSGGNLVLSYRVRVTTPSLIVTPQLSTNLPSGFAFDSSIATNTVGQITNNGVVLEQRTASVPVDSASRKFLRLQVQRGQ